jgi:hypothetical protein
MKLTGFSLWRISFSFTAICGLLVGIAAQSPSAKQEASEFRLHKIPTSSQPLLSLLDLARQKGLKPPVSDDQKLFLYRFSRAGIPLETVLLTPGAVFELEIPPVNKPTCISFRVAMPFNLGDGAALAISIAFGGVERVIFERHFDPAHIRSDRAWAPVDLEIPPRVDASVLRFKVNPGAAGDYSGDWVGIAPGLGRGCLFSFTDDPNRWKN